MHQTVTATGHRGRHSLFWRSPADLWNRSEFGDLRLHWMQWQGWQPQGHVDNSGGRVRREQSSTGTRRPRPQQQRHLPGLHLPITIHLQGRHLLRWWQSVRCPILVRKGSHWYWWYDHGDTSLTVIQRKSVVYWVLRYTKRKLHNFSGIYHAWPFMHRHRFFSCWFLSPIFRWYHILVYSKRGWRQWLQLWRWTRRRHSLPGTGSHLP